jgi:hypothetical protein
MSLLLQQWHQSGLRNNDLSSLNVTLDIPSTPCSVAVSLEARLSSVTDIVANCLTSSLVEKESGLPAKDATQDASPPSSKQTRPPFWADIHCSRQPTHRNSTLQSGDYYQHLSNPLGPLSHPLGPLSNLLPSVPRLSFIHRLLVWITSY